MRHETAPPRDSLSVGVYPRGSGAHSVLIDGTPFKDRQMIVALGIGCDGRKTVLGLRDGAPRMQRW